MDILGHINNVVPVMWFELARNPLFKIFDPELRFEMGTFPLIMAHSEYDYTGQMHFKYEVEMRTWISRIGTKSFTVYQEAWQEGQLCVKGSTVVVHYDFIAKASTPLPEDIKRQLAEGTVLLDQLVTLDYKARSFQFVEKVTSDFLLQLLGVTQRIFTV